MNVIKSFFIGGGVLVLCFFEFIVVYLLVFILYGLRLNYGNWKINFYLVSYVKGDVELES